MTTIDITAVSKLKHSELWEVCKSLGSQTEVARKLGVSGNLVCKWVNLQDYPRATHPRIKEIEAALFELTGKTLIELFPQELRDNAEFLSAPKTTEKRRTFEAAALIGMADRAERRLTVSDPHESLESKELQDDIENVLQSLTERERGIIQMRFGLRPYEYEHHLSEVGAAFGVTRETVRQVEAKALNKLRQPSKSSRIVSHLKDKT